MSKNKHKTGASEEAAILLPDRDIDLADPETGKPVAITVHEFRFLEGLRVQASARALIEDLAALVANEDGDGMTPVRVSEVLGRHADLWIDLCAVATGREADWIARLREPDAGQLSMAVWEVNSVFFTARILGQHLGRDALKEHWASLTSSISSQPQDTGPRTR